jgi:hypothetical protein
MRRGRLLVGVHGKARVGVRSAAMGALAAGAALVGVGLTAAAIDAGGPIVSDATFTGDPIILSAAGLGAPVTVAEVTSLDPAAQPVVALPVEVGNAQPAAAPLAGDVTYVSAHMGARTADTSHPATTNAADTSHPATTNAADTSHPATTNAARTTQSTAAQQPQQLTSDAAPVGRHRSTAPTKVGLPLISNIVPSVPVVSPVVKTLLGGASTKKVAQPRSAPVPADTPPTGSSAIGALRDPVPTVTGILGRVISLL